MCSKVEGVRVIVSIITHQEKLHNSDWVTDCKFIRNLRANSVIRGDLQIYGSQGHSNHFFYEISKMSDICSIFLKNVCIGVCTSISRPRKLCFSGKGGQNSENF